jgi:hypothetical protein
VDVRVPRLAGALDGVSTTIEPDDFARFRPIEAIDVPSGPYLVIDVDLGRETLNVTPDDALERILAEGRSPLTIEEGLALLDQHPEVLRTQNAFSLLGSPLRRPARPGAVAQPGQAEARLVLGRRPPHVARLRVVQRTEPHNSNTVKPRTSA